MTTTQAVINDFLAQKRVAIVGVSRDPQHFSRAVYSEFVKRGYEVTPINPAVKEIDGAPCFDRVQAAPPVDAVMIMTPSTQTDQIVHDCAEAGIKRVWLYKAEGLGAVTTSAVEFCRQNGMSVVDGQCPFMFLPQTLWFHRLHGFIKKVSGSYPAAN
jgi:predicted CoA-binding protein